MLTNQDIHLAYLDVFVNIETILKNMQICKLDTDKLHFNYGLAHLVEQSGEPHETRKNWTFDPRPYP